MGDDYMIRGKAGYKRSVVTRFPNISFYFSQQKTPVDFVYRPSTQLVFYTYVTIKLGNFVSFPSGF